jgi:hypothetical protein
MRHSLGLRLARLGEFTASLSEPPYRTGRGARMMCRAARAARGAASSLRIHTGRDDGYLQNPFILIAQDPPLRSAGLCRREVPSRSPVLTVPVCRDNELPVDVSLIRSSFE